MTDIRTRFAPSPTGYLHVGGIRTAVYAWLLARQYDGKFILRFEDTDKKREVSGSKEHVMQSLRMLGLDYDEGPDINGPFAPYLQSERLDVYKHWANELIDQGRAYADPFSPAEVQTFRDQASKAKRPFLYRNHRPDNPPHWDGTSPLRYKSDPKGYTWQDAIMGKLSAGPGSIDDFILIKTDGFPTYNFAHIIDDHLMQISHVIRGQEFIASVPNYLNLYEALNISPPVLATVPHVLGPDGQKKLSKRDGAKDVLDYIREGYLPEALINFIASLGWNDGSEQEIFSKQQLIDKFSLQRVNRGGAHFDEKRLLWMNGSYIRDLKLDELYERVESYWPQEAADYDETYKKQVLSLIQERLKYFAELAELSRMFFIDLPVDPDLIDSHKQLKKIPTAQLKMLLSESRDSLEASNFKVEDLSERLNSLLHKTSQKPAVLFSLIRIATTQAPSSPGLADSLAVLGKERTLKRIDLQLQTLA